MSRPTSVGQWVQKTLIQSQMIAIREEAKELISVPKSDRKKIVFKNVVPSELKKSVEKGSTIVSRYLAPAWLPKGISVKIAKGDRSQYRRRSRSIHLRKNASPSVAAHELVHPLEYDVWQVKQLTNKFRDGRTRGEALQSLNYLTGSNKYKSWEMAFGDQWRARGGSDYCGKFYRNGITELLTMGIERINVDPLEFYARDPEYFERVVTIFRRWHE